MCPPGILLDFFAYPPHSVLQSGTHGRTVAVAHDDYVRVHHGTDSRAASSASFGRRELCPRQQRASVECALVVPTLPQPAIRAEFNPAVEVDPVRRALHPDDSVCLQQIRWSRSQLGNHPEAVEVRGNRCCASRLSVVRDTDDLGVLGSSEEIESRARVCREGRSAPASLTAYSSMYLKESPQECWVKVVREFFEREHELRFLPCLSIFGMTSRFSRTSRAVLIPLPDLLSGISPFLRLFRGIPPNGCPLCWLIPYREVPLSGFP